MYARSGIEPEGRAAGHHDGVDARNGLGRIEKLGFSRARSAAAHIDRSNDRFVENDHRVHRFQTVAGERLVNIDIGCLHFEILGKLCSEPGLDRFGGFVLNAGMPLGGGKSIWMIIRPNIRI